MRDNNDSIRHKPKERDKNDRKRNNNDSIRHKPRERDKNDRERETTMTA